MDRVREMRAKNDKDALKELMLEEVNAMGEIFSDLRNYNLEEDTVSSVIFLQRRIVGMLKNILESRMDITTSEDKTLDSRVDSLGEKFSKLSIN
jgi:hypothetical protein